VLSRVNGIGSEFQIHLKQRESGRDMMVIKVEREAGESQSNDVHLAEQVIAEIRHKILVRCQVEIVDYGSLPRTERKSRRVFDHRNNNLPI
jgi:phenylacetate-CoA ligase